ncbi:MAG: hypothetical protein OQK73_08365 [Gammaproteobacteria bacterium]|nr:hypothetical protein [Gammaproteobacteria bacterium]
MENTVYGRPIGSHLGKPIYESFETEGHKYIYDRLAECDSEGCPLHQLSNDELLINPGIIYRQV